jgi:hypothetical protein
MKVDRSLSSTMETLSMNTTSSSTPASSTLARTTLAWSTALLVAFSATALSACNRSPAPAAPTAGTPMPAANGEPQTILGKSVAAGLRKAREELETSNLDLDDGIDVHTGTDGHHFRIGGHSTGNSKAQLTPQGDLLIEGKAVPVTPAQRALLLEYRHEIIGVAETGMNIGVKGADLAGKAVLETFAGLMHGNPDEAGKHIDAEGKRLEADAMQICKQLPAMLATQQQLAASLPAFKPYATMEQSDIDDCMNDHGGVSVTSGDRKQASEEIRSEVRDEIRSTIRGSLGRDDADTPPDPEPATPAPAG